LVQFVPRWAHHLDVSGLRWCGVRAASDGTWARSSARFANIAPTMMSWLGLRSCGPSSPHQLSESRPCIWRRPYIDPTEAAGGRRRRTDREEGHPRSAVCEPRPTPIGSSTRCATAAFRGRPYRFPNSPRQVVVPASDVLGCPVHRVQALELGPDELVAVGRDAECFTLKPTPCSGTASAGCCSTGTSLSSA